MENEINTVKAELDSCRRANATVHAVTSSVRESYPPRTVGKQVLLPQDCDRKLYSTAVVGCAENKFKLMVKSKFNQPPDMIKKLLKSKANPTEIKVGSPHLNRLETEESR